MQMRRKNNNEKKKGKKNKKKINEKMLHFWGISGQLVSLCIPLRLSVCLCVCLSVHLSVSQPDQFGSISALYFFAQLKVIRVIGIE